MKYKLFILIQTFALWLIRLTTKNNGYLKHFNAELKYTTWLNTKEVVDNDMQKLICSNVTDLLAVVNIQQHSGFSINYLLDLFNTAVLFKPLTALTGADEEWMEVGSDIYQNKRFGSVFKKGVLGKAYWLDFYVFRDQNGSTFTSYRSRQFIEFPWYPTESTIVEITDDEEGNPIYPDYIKTIVLD